MGPYQYPLIWEDFFFKRFMNVRIDWSKFPLVEQAAHRSNSIVMCDHYLHPVLFLEYQESCSKNSLNNIPGIL